MNYNNKKIYFNEIKKFMIIKPFCYKNFKKRSYDKINFNEKDKILVSQLISNKDIKNFDDEKNNKEFEYEINKSFFKNKKELLILEVDLTQRILIFGFYIFVLLVTIYCFIYVFKRKEKRLIYKVIMFTIGLLLLSILLNFPNSLKKFITKVYLYDSGEKLRLDYYFYKSEVVDIANFIKLKPNNNVIDIKEYKKLLIEGYPIMVNGKLKVVSRNSKFYYKDIYKEIENGTKFKII